MNSTKQSEPAKDATERPKMAKNLAENPEVLEMRRGKTLFLSLLVLAMSFAGNRAFTQASNVVIVSGAITTDTTWTANNVFVLRGAVFVREPATLTIQPGTLVAGELATNGTLVIAPGAKINAVGSAAQPIVFTSDQPPGPPDWPSDDRFRADWGGLIINGRATINLPGGIAFGEGGTGQYGGNNDADNSGTLKYVRVEYAGTEFSPDNELNGIAFQGTGDQTMVDFVQVHMNLDDGIEMFGGTTNLKHVVLTNIGDDSLDYTDGWRGKVQFVVAQQRGDDADQGFEFDNNAENNDLLPRSNPTIYNCTLLGDPFTTFGNESDHGMLLREGTAGTIRNCIVTGFKERGIDVDQSATVAQANAGNLVVSNTIVFANNPNFDADAAPFVNRLWPSILVADPRLVDPFNLTNPDWRPRLDSPAVLGGHPVAPVPAGDPFWAPVDFIGAMGFMDLDDWTKNPVKWTTSDQGFTAFLPGEGLGIEGRPLPRSNGDPLDPQDAQNFLGAGAEGSESPDGGQGSDPDGGEGSDPGGGEGSENRDVG